MNETPAETDWREERARLWAEVHRLRAIENERDYWRTRFAQVEGSLSWRITAPLRAGKTLAVKVRRRLGDED